jgi:hypothetical protein
MKDKNLQRQRRNMNPIVTDRALHAFVRYANIEIGLSRVRSTVSETDRKYARFVNLGTLLDDSR